MTTYFLADIHHNHKNILRFSPQRADILGLDIDMNQLAQAYQTVDQDISAREKEFAREYIRLATNQYDEKLIEVWNSTIGFSDDVYVLGDVSFAKFPEADEFLHQLNGRLHLIRGNHDQSIVNSGRWEWVKDYYEMKHGGQFIVLSHYLIWEHNKKHRGSWHLHGHLHNSPHDVRGKTLDCGMESLGKIAIEFAELFPIMEQNQLCPTHHYNQ